MWKDYYTAIYDTLFLPFCLYFISFMLFSTWFAAVSATSMSWFFIAKIVCLVIFGKTFVTFTCLEIIQFKNDPISYVSDTWNMLDLVSLILNAVFVYTELNNSLPVATINVIGAFAVVLLWFKMFYWLRLFKPFSAFIRIISEIIKDI